MAWQTQTGIKDNISFPSSASTPLDLGRLQPNQRQIFWPQPHTCMHAPRHNGFGHGQSATIMSVLLGLVELWTSGSHGQHRSMPWQIATHAFEAEFVAGEGQRLGIGAGARHPLAFASEPLVPPSNGAGS